MILGNSAPDALHFTAPRMLSELAAPSKTDNPTLTADSLQLFFTSERGASADVYVSERRSTGDAFGAPKRVDAVSSEGIETSPAVSSDGLTLYWLRIARGAWGIWTCGVRRERAATAHGARPRTCAR